jgi:putative protease
MMTDKGENPVYIDQNLKNHLFTAKELCLLPLLDSLSFDKLVSFRIEGQTYTPDTLKDIIKIYQLAMDDPSQCKDLFLSMKSSSAGFTAGSLSYKFNIE